MSTCTEETHRAEKFLLAIAPDLSTMRDDGESDMGRFATCQLCKSTFLVVVAPDPRLALEVAL